MRSKDENQSERTTITLKAGDVDALQTLHLAYAEEKEINISRSTLIQCALRFAADKIGSNKEELLAVLRDIRAQDGRRREKGGSG